MGHRKPSRFKARAAAFAAAALLLTGVPVAPAASASSATQGLNSDASSTTQAGETSATYADALTAGRLTKDYGAQAVTLDLSSASFSGGAASYQDFNGQKLLVWGQAQGALTLPADVAEGAYSIEVAYVCDTSTSADIVRSVRIDGASPFSEADNTKLSRLWPAQGGVPHAADGNARPAVLAQKQALQTMGLSGVYGLYSAALLFYLSKGAHTITLGYVSGSIWVQSVRLVPYAAARSYAAYKAQNAGKPAYTGEGVTVQAEDALESSDLTLAAKAVDSPDMTPYAGGKSRVNAIGGWTWRNGTDWIAWQFSVPEDGLYKLALRVSQDYNGLVSYRRIELDGALPFAELSAYPFDSQTGYHTVQLGGDTPYEFYLTKGPRIR